MPSVPIENLAAELLANHNLLAALAGPTIVLTVDVDGGARQVRLTGEDLTRMLVNLVKNASEAMPAGGRIQIELSELAAAEGAAEALLLRIEDNGPGIPGEALDEVFSSGYTTRGRAAEARGSWPVIHRGLGLAITRSMVEAAGGRITASNRAQGGARFEIELPVR
jgi:two-component system sensor histidine kinase ChvG